MKKLILPALLLCIVLLLTGCACKHAETQLANQKDPTCTENGYTGDTVCLKCKETVTAGEAIEALGHKTEITGKKEANCVNDGYTGDEICTVCKETVAPGEVIPALGHGEIITEGAYESTCESKGFSGMQICSVCMNIVADGEFLPLLPHTPAAERSNAYDPACEKQGYTGNLLCADCGEKLEDGEMIPALGHIPGEIYNAKEVSCVADGYTGDSNCTVCGETIYGEVLPRLAHNWVDGACADCGWIPAGLYVDGVLAMDWEKLVSGGYLTVEGERGERLAAVQQALYGRLVVDESITSFKSYLFYNSMLDEVWLPCTMTEVEMYSFNRAAVKTVRFAPVPLNIRKGAFENASLLEEIIIPEGVTTIPENCFSECVSLKRVVLPSTLEKISNFAFSGCSALAEISLPESLKEIGWCAFSRSGLTAVTAPASLAALSAEAFADCESLVCVDLSASAITSLNDFAPRSPALMEIKFPQGLVSAQQAYSVANQVEALVLPDTLTEFTTSISKANNNTCLRTIVWPLSLKDAAGFHFCNALETIYYKGSEFEWSLINNIDGLGDVNVVFNYTGE